MTLSTLLAFVKRRLGLSNLKIPNITDEDLIDVIFEDTINTINKYYPRQVKLRLTEYESVPGEDNTYYINTSYFGEDVKLLGVVKLLNNEIIGQPYVFDYEDALMSSAKRDLYHLFNEQVIFNFIAPNKVEFSHNLSLPIDIMIKIGHPRNLKTIPAGLEDTVKKLALLDIKIFLYNQLKFIDTIETTMGTINLRIEDWRDAETQREEFEENLASKSIYDAVTDIMII